MPAPYTDDKLVVHTLMFGLNFHTFMFCLNMLASNRKHLPVTLRAAPAAAAGAITMKMCLLLKTLTFCVGSMKVFSVTVQCHADVSETSRQLRDVVVMYFCISWHVSCSVLSLCTLKLQIGEYFEGIEPQESCYKVNAYLNYRYPEDWIAAI